MQVKTPGSDIAISKLSGGNQQKIVVGKALEAIRRSCCSTTRPTAWTSMPRATSPLRSPASRTRAAAWSSLSELTEMIENCDRILLIKYNRIVGELRDVPGSD